MNQDKIINDMINNEKDICKKNIFKMIDQARNYHVNNIDISKYYNLPEEFDKYKIDDITNRFKLNDEVNTYKIDILNSLLKDLYNEKKFLEYRFKKEQELSQQEYIDYSTNIVTRNDYVSKWLNEFNNK